MQKIKKLIISILVFSILIVPVLSFAAAGDPLVTCTDNCNWNELMTLINTVIHFILFYLAIPIAAIMFIYAGFLLITAGGEAAGARTKAKSIFTNALIGLILAAAAWLIIKLILSILGYEGAWIGF
ncbi:MAG: hypothetical protein WC884_00440 [Candidatus Paceibacterota bacterium]